MGTEPTREQTDKLAGHIVEQVMASTIAERVRAMTTEQLTVGIEFESREQFAERVRDRIAAVIEARR